MSEEINRLVSVVKNKNKTNIKVLLVSILCVLSLEPYIIWFFTEYLRFLSLICIFFILRSFKAKLPLATIWAVILIFYLIGVCFNDITQLYSVVAFEVLFLLFLPLISSLELTKIYSLVVTIIAVIYLLGIPFFIIDKFIELPYFTIPSRNTLIVQTYKDYVFFIQAVQNVDLFPRFRSIFDEAGVVGTFSFLLLTGNKYRLTNWKLVVVFIGGLLSFSFFFYAGSLIVFFLFNLNNRKILLAGIAFIIGIFFTLQNNEVFATLILDRFVVTDNGIAGDNRTTENWSVHFKEFSKTSDFYTGRGFGSYDLKKYPGVASYQTFIYDYGWIAAVITLLYFFFLLRREINLRDSCIVLVALMLAFYQRPWVFDYFYTIVAASAAANIATLSDNTQVKKRKLNFRKPKVQLRESFS